MEYVKRGLDGVPSGAGDQGTFTGRVALEGLVDDGDAPKVRVLNVGFEPGGRTFWHSHANGQVIVVGSGRGAVASRDGDRHVLEPGDLVWAPPGEEHWHGAAPDSPVIHTAVSLGPTLWAEEVTDEDYRAAFDEG